MTEPRWRIYKDRTAFARALADALAADLAGEGPRTLGLSGGATPEAAYRELFKKPLDWRRITAVVVDERQVPAGHPHRNEAMIRASLGPAPVTLVPTEAATGIDRLDTVLLGMGEDGHFASIFPGAANRDALLDPDNPAVVMATTPDPLPAAAPHPRWTMTLAFLARAPHIHLGIAGDAKADVLRAALASGACARWPVAALAGPRMPPLIIHWSRS